MKSITITLLFILLQFSERKIKILSCGQLRTVLVPTLTNTHTTHRWPWHAAIYHQIDQNSSSYQCGGTLINSNAILTAAHCVQVDAQFVTVSLGRIYLDAKGSDAPVIKVTQIISHPDFKQENQENDIAVILLSTRVIYNNYVQPVCLWSAEKIGFSNVVGKDGTVVGWGRTETGEFSNALREASLPVVAPFVCLKSNRDLFGRYLSETNFCAGTRNGTSVCTGDSGGSMTFETNGRYYIRGIVSVGPSKRIIETSRIVCDPMQYALFTDIVPYVPWIRRIVDVERLGECETMVRCSWSSDMHRCTADIKTTECQIVFNEISNPAATKLKIIGKSDVIPDLADAASKFENLNTLVIAKLSLKEVQRDRLTPFSNITKLRLFSNDISQFDAPDTFNDLTNLEELDISRNKLTELHDNIFTELKNLEILRLNINNLAILPADIFRGNRKMRELSLSYNQLKKLHADLSKELHNLEIIRLGHNQLESMPPGLFRDNVKSKGIYLDWNQLRELHADQFKGLSSLQILRLSNNNLETLPVGLLYGNGKLRVLSVDNNQLQELHSDLFKELSILEEIRLNSNQLETIPSGLFRNNRMLKTIRLENNKIKKIEPDFNRMTLSLLTILDLNRNICISDRCGWFSDSCSEPTLSRIFDKIKQNC